ncbi:MAG TPA: hypothetical protein VHX37_08555 [Acidobacteriaceae bacterium]|jgi:hypothetical protein|nr:hypothetical protein [Acidobacteriaceae bacterium]
MKLVFLAVPAMAALAAVPLAMNAAGSHDFNAVVSAVEQRYSSHAERVPLMGLVSFCAWAASGGGVKGMRVAEFEHLPAAESGDLEGLVRNSLGQDWQLFVADRSRNGDVSLIYVQPEGGSMRMLVADYEHGELDVVRLEVNGDRLQRWMHDPEGSARKHDYAGRTPD